MMLILGIILVLSNTPYRLRENLHLFFNMMEKCIGSWKNWKMEHCKSLSFSYTQSIQKRMESEC